jgi:cytochrome c5
MPPPHRLLQTRRARPCRPVLLLCAALSGWPFAAAASDGEAVYRATCSTCHDSGAGNAPRVGMAAEWHDRFAAGRAALQQAALNGVANTAMAAKGGFGALSDAQVRAAVDYMLSRTGFVEPAEPRPARPAILAIPTPSAGGDSQPDDLVLTARVAAALRSALTNPTAPIEAHEGELIVRGIGVRVGARAGIVRLMGVVQDAAIVKRAEALAAAVTGVRGVENRLVSGGMLDFD